MSFLKSLVRSALAVLNAVEVNDSLHSLFGKSVVGVSTVDAVFLVVIIDVVVVEAVHKGERGLVSLSCSYELCTVDSKAECLTEGLVRENYRVGVTLGVVHLLEVLKVGVEEEGHCVCLVNLVEVVRESVGRELVCGRRPVRKLTLKEQLLHSSLFHNVDNDLSGLVLLTLLAVNEEVGEGVEVAVLILLPAVPVLVANEYDLLFLLKRFHSVCTVGHSGLLGSTVGGCYELTGGILEGVVKLSVNEPCICARGKEVVDADVVLCYVADGVIINLVATNGIVLNLITVGVGEVEESFLNVVSALSLVGDAEYVVKELGDSSEDSFLVLSGDLGVTVSVRIFSKSLEESLHISVAKVFVVKSCKAQVVESHICGAYVYVKSSVSDSLIKIEGVVGGIILAVCRNNGSVDGSLRVVERCTTCESRLAGDVEVSSVVSHLGVKESLHGLDVVVSGDLYTVLPSCLGVESDLKYEACFNVSYCLSTCGKSRTVLGEVVLVILGNVLDGSSHFVNPLIYTVLGVENGHINEGRRNVAEHRLVSVFFPCVGVPVGTESCCSGLVGVILTVSYEAFFGVGGVAVICGLVIVGSLIGGLVVFRSLGTSCENAYEHNDSHQKRQNLDAFHF